MTASKGTLARRRTHLAYALVAPATLLILLIYVGPIIAVVLASMTDYTLIRDGFAFVGTQNYTAMFADPAFANALWNTVIYAVYFLPAAFVISLLLALAIQSRKNFRSVLEVIYFLPVTSTLAAMALVWAALMDSRQGVINNTLKLVGAGPINFLGNPEIVLPALAAISLWSIIGFNMVLFLAGLTAIPRNLYDAAAIDGIEHPVDRFLRVTWPMLAPTSVFVAVTTSITAFKLFDTVALLTKGGPGRSSEVYLYLTFLEGFEYFNMGYAAALSVFFLGIIFLLALIQTLMSDRRVNH
jgi:multiple sugar transport system permease protein